MGWSELKVMHRGAPMKFDVNMNTAATKIAISRVLATVLPLAERQSPQGAR